MLSEPPGADPHAGWCGRGQGKPGPYPIRCGGGRQPQRRFIPTQRPRPRRPTTRPRAPNRLTNTPRRHRPAPQNRLQRAASRGSASISLPNPQISPSTLPLLETGIRSGRANSGQGPNRQPWPLRPVVQRLLADKDIKTNNNKRDPASSQSLSSSRRLVGNYLATSGDSCWPLTPAHHLPRQGARRRPSHGGAFLSPGGPESDGW